MNCMKVTYVSSPSRSEMFQSGALVELSAIRILKRERCVAEKCDQLDVENM